MSYKKYCSLRAEETEMSHSVMLEKKPSSIKQTAAKIKTKIHNTSSFFKLSLKTNNKALALALAAQKQKTRQLETDAMRLQKDVQSLNFDLAVQRHKNKQMFTVLREFYNNSINCMAKAVDLISSEEGTEILDAESSKDVCQAEKNLTDLLPEQRNTNNISKSLPQEKPQTTTVNISLMDLRRPCNSSLKSKEISHTTPQNTLYDSEMEITMVDSTAEIVTVQTKPIINHDDGDQQRCEKNNTCSSRRGERSMSSYHETTGESSYLKDMTMIGFMETPSEIQHLKTKTTSTFTCSSEEDPIGFLHGGEKSVTARRKTHVTSRNPKNKRFNFEELTAENPDTRKSGIIPSHSNHTSDADDLDDFFSDQKVKTQIKSKTISCDGNFYKCKDTESEEDAQETQNEGVNLRKTFVIPPKSRPKQSRKSKASDLSMEQNKLSVNESLNSTDAATLDMVTDVMEMSANPKRRRTRWSTHKEHNTVKSRGTYVIHTNPLSDYSDILNDNIDLQVDSGEIANTMALECNQESHSNNALTTEEQRIEGDDSHMLENRPYLKHSITLNDKNLPEQISELSSLGHTKPKKAKKEMVKKARKKNITTRESAIGKKKQQCSSTQSSCTLATKMSDPLNIVKEINSSTDVLRLAAGDLHSIATEEDLGTEFYEDQGYTTNVHSRCLDHNDDVDINPKDGSQCQNNQNSKSKSRPTYVVLSGHSLPVNGKETTVVFNSSFEESLITNDKENSLHADRNTFFPHHYNENQSAPRRTDQVMQQQEELLGEERPPWESLSFGTSMSLACESPVTHQRTSRDISSRTMDIYEEPGLNMIHQSPGRRAMKSLTNTDLTADAPSRSRRKAAPMSYKEPPLNSKMRRGDKFSDTRFLSSPVFKDKRKKHSTKNKQ